MNEHIIIGCGPAGVMAAETLRSLDGQSKITLVTDEGHPFYRREHIVRLASGEEWEEGLRKGKSSIPDWEQSLSRPV